jgi:tRNA(Ser,Leu) C12 N-acetylase TAN1
MEKKPSKNSKSGPSQPDPELAPAEMAGSPVKSWNVVLTILTGRDSAVLKELQHRGDFRRSGFKGVITGWVEDVSGFLEAVDAAQKAGTSWAKDIARVLPVEETFQFTPSDLEEKLQETVSPLLHRMGNGTFHIRIERRGFKGKIISPDVERDIDKHLIITGEMEGRHFRVSFDNPDYIIAAETVGNVCGVTLLTRELREKYPLIKVR